MQSSNSSVSLKLFQNKIKRGKRQSKGKKEIFASLLLKINE